MEANPVSDETTKHDSSDNPIASGTFKLTRRQITGILLAVLAAVGGSNAVAQWNVLHMSPQISDSAAAIIGKNFADAVKESNDKLIRSIESMNEATRDLAKSGREQNEWCKMVIGEFTKELRAIKEEIIYSRELQVKAAREGK